MAVGWVGRGREIGCVAREEVTDISEGREVSDVHGEIIGRQGMEGGGGEGCGGCRRWRR